MTSSCAAAQILWAFPTFFQCLLARFDSSFEASSCLVHFLSQWSSLLFRLLLLPHLFLQNRDAALGEGLQQYRSEVADVLALWDSPGSSASVPVSLPLCLSASLSLCPSGSSSSTLERTFTCESHKRTSQRTRAVHAQQWVARRVTATLEPSARENVSGSADSNTGSTPACLDYAIKSIAGLSTCVCCIPQDLSTITTSVKLSSCSPCAVSATSTTAIIFVAPSTAFCPMLSRPSLPRKLLSVLVLLDPRFLFMFRLLLHQARAVRF